MQTAQCATQESEHLYTGEFWIKHFETENWISRAIRESMLQTHS